MPITVFHQGRVLARGDERHCVQQVRACGVAPDDDGLLAFDDETGQQVYLGQDGDVSSPRRRGRPALGVEAREITLLPRHWEWLSAQPGGASAALRGLVEEARRLGRSREECLEAAARFLAVMAGDRPGCEEAIQALYLGDRENFDALSVLWPSAVAAHARQLAWPRDAQWERL